MMVELEVKDQLFDHFALRLHIEITLTRILEALLDIGTSDVLVDHSVLRVNSNDEQKQKA